MAITISFSNATYTIPSTAERNWSDNLNAYLIALSTGALPKGGGTFSLSNDLDLGSVATVSLKAIASKTGNAANTGFVRLANTDDIMFRNNANSGNLVLKGRHSFCICGQLAAVQGMLLHVIKHGGPHETSHCCPTADRTAGPDPKSLLRI